MVRTPAAAEPEVDAALQLGGSEAETDFGNILTGDGGSNHVAARLGQRHTTQVQGERNLSGFTWVHFPQTNVELSANSVMTAPSSSSTGHELGRELGPRVLKLDG